MNKTGRFVRHLGVVVMGLALVLALDALLPVRSWAQQGVRVLTSVLPTGAATESTLASIDGKLPALEGGEVPVVCSNCGGGGAGDASLEEQEVQSVILGAIQVAAEALADLISGGALKVTDQNEVSLDDGAVDATTLRVTVASDATITQDMTRTADAVELIESKMAADPVHGNTLSASGPQVIGEAKTVDGSTLPNVVAEGQPVRQALSVSGVAHTALTNQAGTVEYGTNTTPFVVDLGSNNDVVNTPVGNSIIRYISVGTTEDKQEIKSSAGVLVGISARNSNASANAHLKCVNQVAASTTPGTNAIFYEMMIPANSGFVDSQIHATFSVGLTCYIVLGAASTAVDEVAANEVAYTVRFR